MRNVALALLALSCEPVLAADACSGVPATLATQLEKAFPAYRLPVAADNLQEDNDWNAQHGGTGCLGVAHADFDGDKVEDLLLGLTARKGTGALIVVALAGSTPWKIKVLEQWPEGRSRLYVEAGLPDTYHRTEALDGPLEKGEVDPLKCKYAAAIFGMTESTGVAHCLADGKWRHVWISD